jgi:hypothetical protein
MPKHTERARKMRRTRVRKNLHDAQFHLDQARKAVGEISVDMAAEFLLDPANKYADLGGDIWNIQCQIPEQYRASDWVRLTMGDVLTETER